MKNLTLLILIVTIVPLEVAIQKKAQDIKLQKLKAKIVQGSR